jgi:tRNA(adenine34) deaminase
MNILQHPQLNHQIEVTTGVLADEAAQYIRAFFAQLRADGQRH